MKEFTILMLLFVSMTIMAQTRAGDSTPKEPQGATYTLSDGSTVTKTGETINSETQYYNVVQVTKGSLTLDGCTLTKTGDGTSGDNSSFYGNTCTEDHEGQLDVSGHRQCRQRQ